MADMTTMMTRIIPSSTSADVASNEILSNHIRSNNTPSNKILLSSIPIIYQDEDIVVINKPAGWLVHRSWLDRKETKIIMQAVRDQIGQYVYTVHRLDKPTSGVMVLALNKTSAHHLSLQFETQKSHKTYYAIVRGYLLGNGTVDYPLVEELDKVADKHATKEKTAQSAITHYESIATCEMPVAIGKYQTARYSLIKLNPVTGRKHQLRRHLSHLRHPIIGDTAHGDLKQNRGFFEAFCAEDDLERRLYLHASDISFNHPRTNKLISFKAGIENEVGWLEILHRLNWIGHSN